MCGLLALRLVVCVYVGYDGVDFVRCEGVSGGVADLFGELFLGVYRGECRLYGFNDRRVEGVAGLRIHLLSW